MPKKTTLCIKPRQNVLVRDPVTMQPLPPEGVIVAVNSHWLRRLAEGDVELIVTEEQSSESIATQGA